MREEKISMSVVNPHAEGIDVGSRSHWVSIGRGSGDFKEFGVYNEDLYQISAWLKDNEIETVAMESTGTYWQSLFSVLVAEKFKVILCNGKFTKNIKRRRTSWIANGFRSFTASVCFLEVSFLTMRLSICGLFAATARI